MSDDAFIFVICLWISPAPIFLTAPGLTATGKVVSVLFWPLLLGVMALMIAAGHIMDWLAPVFFEDEDGP